MTALRLFLFSMLFMSTTSSSIPEMGELKYNYNYSYATTNCSECIHFMDRVKNETQPIINIVNQIEKVCGHIFGPAAKQCVNITSDLEKTLEHIEHTNATVLCKEIHYC